MSVVEFPGAAQAPAAAAEIKPHPMATQLNLGDVVSWRLHWLLCDLWNLKRDLQASTDQATTSSLQAASVFRLQEGAFGKALEKVQAVQARHDRLRWETKTMLGLDYDSDVEPLFASIPKNAEYLKELVTIKAMLQRLADHAIEQDARRLREAIAKNDFSEITEAPSFLMP